MIAIICKTERRSLFVALLLIINGNEAEFLLVKLSLESKQCYDFVALSILSNTVFKSIS